MAHSFSDGKKDDINRTYDEKYSALREKYKGRAKSERHLSEWSRSARGEVARPVVFDRADISSQLREDPDAEVTPEDIDTAVKLAYQEQIDLLSAETLKYAEGADAHAARLEGWAQAIYRNPEAAKRTNGSDLTPQDCVGIENDVEFDQQGAEELRGVASRIIEEPYQPEKYQKEIGEFRQDSDLLDRNLEPVRDLPKKLAELSASDATTVGELKQVYAGMYRGTAEHWEKAARTGQQFLDRLRGGPDDRSVEDTKADLAA